MITEEKRSEIKKEFNHRLKKIETYEELEELIKEMNTYGLTFTGRRRSIGVFDFQLLDYTKDTAHRVRYLYDDGVSVGKAYVKNLHRVVKIDN